MNLFAFEFMQRALLGALLTGLAAPAIGTYLVQRRLSLMGDGIGHVALTGVALGLLTGAFPVVTAMAVATAGAVAIEVVRMRGKASGDVALAMLFYGGIAGGVLLTGLAGGSAAMLNSYLFGSLTTVARQDLIVITVLAALVLGLTLGLSRQLFAVCQDEEFARVAGLRVPVYNVLIAVLAALTVTVAMRVVGLLLVSALMVVPVATAQQLTRSFRATLLAAMGLGVVAAFAGVVLSFYVDVAPGASIVVVALGGFVLATTLAGARNRRRRVSTGSLVVAGLGSFATAPMAEGELALHVHAEEHAHLHGDGCGHDPVPHGDHVDYVHDGHRHAEHGAHYDEH
jgi:zinc transport system permease protein